MNALAKNLPWRRLTHLAAPYRGQFVVVALLAAASMVRGARWRSVSSNPRT